MTPPSKIEVQDAIAQYTKELAKPLRELNRKVGARIFSDYLSTFF